LADEEWRQIEDFPDYAVSSEGRVRRILSGKVLRQHHGRYATLNLYRDKKRFCALVHRLVCKAFHGDPPAPGHEVAHRDGDGLNNRKGNLRWATHAENEADKLAHGTSLAGRPSFVRPERRSRGLRHGRHTMPEKTARGERNGLARLTEVKVTAIRLDRRPRKEIAASYGISVTMVGFIQRGVSWAHVPMPQPAGEQA
jgi:hypothetical protein